MFHFCSMGNHNCFIGGDHEMHHFVYDIRFNACAMDMYYCLPC